MLKEMNRLWKLADRRTGMNILICDDELLAAEKIADLVSHFAAQRHLAVSVVKFTDVEKCMKSSLERCDIAFLDIDMKPYNGIDLARVLHDANPNAIIIFVTNYIEYAPAGYEVNAFRYLLKPEMEKTFDRFFEDALDEYKKYHQIVSFSIDSEHIEVPVQNILYFESEQRIMKMHLIRGDRLCHRFYASMTQMTAELEPMGFLRIQKSYLVNMEYIEMLKYGETRLKGGIVLKSSEKNHSEIKQRYSLWRAKNRWSIV
jgi:DNA-binding LytR/AlgR family response regulator|nr:LytTR family DNA-binding domain-containing protein [uncultured Gemmiger sp.]